MRQNEDGKTVAAMDVLLPKVGEVIGGSQREERLEYLDKMIEEKVGEVESTSFHSCMSKRDLLFALMVPMNDLVAPIGFG